MRPMRTIVSKLRRKLDDDADNPTYIYTEPRVGYWMPTAETEHTTTDQRSAENTQTESEAAADAGLGAEATAG